MATAVAYPTQQVTETVIVQQRKDIYPFFVSRKARSTASSQVILGILCIIFQIAATSLDAYYSSVAAGIWGGGVFILAGCIGLSIGGIRSPNKMGCYAFFSFAAFCCSIGLLAVASIGIDHDSEYLSYYCSYYYDCATYNSRVAMNAMLVIFAIIEIITSANAMIICKKAFSAGEPETQIANVTRPNQAVVVVSQSAMPTNQYVPYQAGPMQPYTIVQGQAPPAYNETMGAAPVYNAGYPPAPMATGQAPYPNANYSQPGISMPQQEVQPPTAPGGYSNTGYQYDKQ